MACTRTGTLACTQRYRCFFAYSVTKSSTMTLTIMSGTTKVLLYRRLHSCSAAPAFGSHGTDSSGVIGGSAKDFFLIASQGEGTELWL